MSSSLSPYSSLLGLLPEVAEEIFAKCSIEDLKNVAQCSKKCCETVRDLLWSELRIHWISLEDTNIAREKLKFIHLTTSLEIAIPLHIMTNRRMDSADGFRYILNACDPTRLRSLEFKSYLPSGALGLAAGVLTQLTQLCVVEVKLPTSDEWKSICKFPKLKELHIIGCNIDDTTLEEIDNLVNLRNLTVECFDINLDLVLQRASVLHGLEKLMLSEHRSEEEDEAAPASGSTTDTTSFPPLLSLKELNLTLENILDRPFECISNSLPCLTKIHLENCFKLTEGILPHIAKLRFLKELQLIGTKVTDEGIRCLSLSTTLAILIIDTCKKVTDIGISYLTKFSALSELYIAGNNGVSDDGLLELSKCSNLRTFSFRASDLITNKGIAYISDMSAKQFLLSLDDTKIDDNGLLSLTKIATSLTHLYLMGCQGITDNGMEHISQLVRLKELNLSGTNITDEGVHHLEKLESLLWLGLGGCALSEDVLLEMKKKDIEIMT